MTSGSKSEGQPPPTLHAITSKYGTLPAMLAGWSRAVSELKCLEWEFLSELLQFMINPTKSLKNATTNCCERETERNHLKSQAHGDTCRPSSLPAQQLWSNEYRNNYERCQIGVCSHSHFWNLWMVTKCNQWYLAESGRPKMATPEEPESWPAHLSSAALCCVPEHHLGISTKSLPIAWSNASI